MRFYIRIGCALLCALLLFSAVPVSAGAAFSGADRIVIVLDPGHGGGSIGTAVGNTGEKVMTLKLAGLIRDRLNKNGNFVVHMTRTGDTDLSICDRALKANDVNADLLISIHFDGSTNSAEHGATAYTSVFSKWALVTLGNKIVGNISSATGLSSNGVKQKADTEGYYWNSEFQWDAKDKSLGTLSDYYGVPTWCAKFGIPSLIIEHGFFTNAKDRDIIFANGTLEKMADAEASAIIDYFTKHTHSYGAAAQDFPSNCMFTGKQSRRCTTCGHRTEVTSLAAAPNRHYWMWESGQSASCGVDGYANYVCRITQNLNEKEHPCKEHTKIEVIPAPNDHNYQRTEHVDATHTVDGYSVYTCSICGHSYRQAEPAEGHKWEYVKYIDPTCTERGGDLSRCSVCGEEYLDPVPATGHTWDPDAHEETPADCVNAGYIKDVCAVCGAVSESHPEALGHGFDLDRREVAPTCTQDGSFYGRCVRCDEEKEEVLPATGHTLMEISRTAPGCETEGVIRSVCTVCEAEEEAAIPVAGHTYGDAEITEATCTQDGIRTRACTVCGYMDAETLSASGHVWNSAVTERAAGLLFAGMAAQDCANGCGEIKYTRLPAWVAQRQNLPWVISIAAVLALAVAASIAVPLILHRRRTRMAFAGAEFPADLPEATTPRETATEAEKATTEV